MQPTLDSFAAFWPYYVSQHLNRSCRRWHFTGTALAGVCGVLALVRSPVWAPIGLAVGYACSWVGHFAFEKNVPATFQRPLYSFIGDLRMFHLMLTGEMDGEIERILQSG